METMVFKTFTWPLNPETYREDVRREPVYEKDDNGNPVFQGLGPVQRVITGEGAFLGTSAETDYTSLAALLDDATAGVLKHPAFGERTVFFTGLQLTQSPRRWYVRYSFEFREADDQGTIPV